VRTFCPIVKFLRCSKALWEGTGSEEYADRNAHILNTRIRKSDSEQNTPPERNAAESPFSGVQQHVDTRHMIVTEIAIAAEFKGLL
jgi:hypothetical protein